MTGIVQSLIGSFGSVVSAVTDAYFNLVTLLLPGNGTNGAQNNTFLDSSSNNFTITRNGNTTQGTFSPFSQTGWSNYFNGSTDSIYTPSNAALGFGTGDFTVEFWIYPISIASKSLYHGSATNSLVINTDASGKFIVRQYGVADLFTSSAALSTNAWNHVAVSRSGTTISAWLNGSRANGFTGTNSTNWATTAVYIGAADTAANYVNAYFSNVRVVKGTDVYGVSNSTITVPTSPLTAITNTSLLTCQSNRFLDNSSNAFAITVNGTPSVQAFSPFAPTAAYSASTNGGSGYFDGTGDNLTYPAGTSQQFGTSDFTVECWVYFTADPHSGMFLIDARDASNTSNWCLYFGSGNSITWLKPGGVTITNTTVYKQNTWYHVAYVRSGTTGTIYVNGASAATGTDSDNYTVSNNTTYIASRYTSANYVQGYMSGLRILKGTAQYTAAFTPPTAPPTAITNTQLLLNFTNAGIIDSTAKNALETVGNAQISTTQSKFGGSSMYFDGNGDYLAFPSSNQYLNLGSGDFTIEGWFYQTASTTFQTIFSTTADYTTANQLRLSSGSTGTTLRVASGSGAGTDWIDASTTYSINTWNHFAVVRNGSTITLYLNGTNVGTKTSVSTTFVTNTFWIGNTFTGSTNYYFNGYIDDFRVTKFARYTANFTAPTAAFALQ